MVLACMRSPLPHKAGNTAAQVMEARHRELGRLRQAVPARVGMQVLLFSTPTLAAVFAFAAYGSAAPNDFTAPHIFSAIAYFAIMRFPLIFLRFALVQVCFLVAHCPQMDG